MRVEGGLVNPDHERRVAQEYSRYRARGVIAIAAGVIVFAAVLGVLFAVTAPWLAASVGFTPDFRGGVALFAGALLVAGAVTTLAWRFSDARWKRVRSDSELVRSTWVLFDTYGPPGRELDDRTLWEALAEEQRIGELRKSQREILAIAPGSMTAAQQAILVTVTAAIAAGEKEQRERLAG